MRHKTRETRKKGKRLDGVKTALIIFWVILILPLLLFAVYRASYYYTQPFPWEADGPGEIILAQNITLLPGNAQIIPATSRFNLTDGFTEIEFLPATFDGVIKIEFEEENGILWQFSSDLELTEQKGHRLKVPLSKLEPDLIRSQNKKMSPVRHIKILLEAGNGTQTNLNSSIMISTTKFITTRKPLIIFPQPAEVNWIPHRVYQSTSKSDGTFRIVALGDSMVYGVSICQDIYEEQTAMYLLEEKLNSDAISRNDFHNGSITNYEVLNFGVPGYNTKQEVDLYESVAAGYDPDLVLLFFLGNDVEDNGKMQEIMNNLSGTPAYAVLRESQTPHVVNLIMFWEANTLYREMYNGTDIWEAIGMNETINQFERLRKMTEGKKFAIAVWYAGPEYQYIAIQEYALKNNIPLLNLRDLPKEYGPKRIYSCPDGITPDIHPSPFGHEKTAEKAYAFLKENRLIPE